MNTVCLCTQLADENITEEERDTVYDADDETGKMLRTLLQRLSIFCCTHSHKPNRVTYCEKCCC